MTRDRGARIVAGLAALGYLGTAWLHSTGYESSVRAAQTVPGMFGQILPGLWILFSFDLAILGLIVAVLAFRPRDIGRPILVLAALCPLAAAGLQLRFIGFIPPTGLLIGLGILTWIAAAVWPPEREPAMP